MAPVHYDEGIANPIGPEPCVVGREAGGGTSLGEDSSLGKRRGICLARIRMERSHAPDPDPPAELSAEQRPLYDDMKAVIERNFTGFKAIREDGALIGPWTPWLRWPQYGDRFGGAATAELIYLVGLYCLVAVTLNGFDVPLPE